MTKQSKQQRLTKIVCTLGPACATKEQIIQLAESGLNIARINMSHGTREEHEDSVRILKEINNETDHCIGILLDTKGAEIRTGDVTEPIEVHEGDEVTFYLPHKSVPNGIAISVNYDGFVDDVQETDCILVDNGELSFDIVSVKNSYVTARARQSGIIGSRRHINLPGADVDLPSITEKDWSDIAMAVEQEVDFIALSFIRNGNEVREVQKYLQEHNSAIQIITKIETRQAVDNIADILEVSDGIMVARGDLGAEVPFERLPSIQDEIVVRCRDAGKPVIVATHMLESMKEHPIPTRAEMTDVSHAAMTMADATMLSGETAGGKHPPVAVDAMHKLLMESEKAVDRLDDRSRASVHTDREAKAESAVNLANTIHADALLVITRSGMTAREVSKFRPRMPTIACTPDTAIQRKMQLLYGVYPLSIAFEETEETVQNAIEAAIKHAYISHGDTIVLLTNVVAGTEDVWSIQTREV